jgi:molybdenum cofactor cytidylyltransferase
VVVVLAAGKGSRFVCDERAGVHGHKLAQPFATNTVLGSTAEAVRESGLPMVIVTMPAWLELVVPHAAAHDIVVLPVDNREAGPSARGMGDSIAAGVGARLRAPGWLVLPADMPMVRPGTLRAVADALRGHAIAHPLYRGRRGHPVGFRAELCDELLALHGDEGARRLLERHAACGIEVDDPGAVLDLDTAEDLAALHALHARMQACRDRR